eukprot:8632813-Heterocapsa_arctica.AAC.1
MLKEELGQDPPDWVTSFKMWDETGERVVLPLGSGTAQIAVSEVWHVLVTKMSFSWGYFDERRPAASLDLILPPVAVPTTSADSIFYAFRCHPLVREAFDFSRLASVVGEKASHPYQRSDNASANRRLLAHEMNMAPTVCADDFVCRNHANHLAQSMLFGA